MQLPNETLATSDSGVLSIGEAATAGYNVLNALNNLNTMLDSTSGSEVADATKAIHSGRQRFAFECACFY